MSERSAAIGLASASSGLPPPNSSACGFEMNDQVTASTMPRAASARLALRVRIWIGVSTGLRGASPRSNGVDGTRSTPTMRTTSSTMSALPSTSRPPGRHRDLHASRPARRRRSRAGRARVAPRPGRRRGRRAAATRRAENRSTRSGASALPATVISRRLAAAEVEHHAGRELEARQHEGRIDAALEAIARIGIDAELAAGLRDVERLPQRRLDQHVGGRLRAAGRLAAHDAGERLDAVLVGDHADRLVERVGLAVERQQALARAWRGAP